MQNYELFRLRLKWLREGRRGLKRCTLSELCGLSSDAIARYERGEAVPTVETLEKIADFFGVSVDYLIGRKNY